MPDSLPTLPSGLPLAEQTHAEAGRLYEAVGNAYLIFRREYFQDPNPSLATLPPRSEKVQQTEAARLAAGTLRVVPQEFRRVPVVRDVINHLQWEVDIHTLTERERVDLHNVTMTFMHGISGGIQPWYVEWLAAAQYALQEPLHPDYFLAYPWQGRLYRSPEELRVFDSAIRAGDIPRIEHEIERVADGLVRILHDPLGTQPELAFSGPNAERRRALFNLKTAAGLALGAYLAAEIVRNVLAPQPSGPPKSVLPAVPPQLAARVVPDEGRR
jgi:hypothetical protein